MIHFELHTTGGAQVSFIPAGFTAENPVQKWAQEHAEFTAKQGDLFYMPHIDRPSDILVGLGDVDKLSLENLRYLFFQLARLADAKKEKELEIHMPDLGKCNQKTLMAALEGLRHAAYRFENRLERTPELELTVHYHPFAGSEEKLHQGIQRTTDMMDGVFLARDLTNETANHLYPETLAQRAAETLTPLGVDVHVYEEDAIREIGMKAFLAVGQGSARRPRLIVMNYRGASDDAPLTALVGKGITYDSGGYCVKTAAGMLTMHSDMGGAGTVIGTLAALAKAKAPCNVVGVVAACENLISGGAYKTGDIIGSLSGKTIEIVNTDAEGRVTLADAVYYATHELKADRIIDLATLTGACVVALGPEITGAVTNNEAFFTELQAAAATAGEKVWQLPNDESFAKMNKSKVADIKNSGGRYGGASSAGLFVGSFIKEGTPWIHLDIAGPAYLDDPSGYLPDRATGVQVRTLFNLLHPLSVC